MRYSFNSVFFYAILISRIYSKKKNIRANEPKKIAQEVQFDFKHVTHESIVVLENLLSKLNPCFSNSYSSVTDKTKIEYIDPFNSYEPLSIIGEGKLHY